MPVEVLPRAARGGGESRLSSFGFSGTIAHGAFGAAVKSGMPDRCATSSKNLGSTSLMSLFR